MTANVSLRSFLTAVLLLFIFLPIISYSQDQSTIYFYRPKHSINVAYEVMEGTTSVGIMRPSNVVVYKCSAGAHDFLATGRIRSSFKMDTEAGKEYFVLCGVAADSTQRATFRLARKGESRMEIRKIDEVTASKITPTVLTTSPDTVRALRHLYKRKRGWGIGFAIAGTLWTVGDIGRLASYEPEKIDIGYGQSIEHDARPTLVFSLLTSMAIATVGYTRFPVYKDRKLDAILEDRAEGAPWPPKIMKKLKQRDFEAQ